MMQAAAQPFMTECGLGPRGCDVVAMPIQRGDWHVPCVPFPVAPWWPCFLTCGARSLCPRLFCDLPPPKCRVRAASDLTYVLTLPFFPGILRMPACCIRARMLPSGSPGLNWAGVLVSARWPNSWVIMVHIQHSYQPAAPIDLCGIHAQFYCAIL